MLTKIPIHLILVTKEISNSLLKNKTMDFSNSKARYLTLLNCMYLVSEIEKKKSEIGKLKNSSIDFQFLPSLLPSIPFLCNFFSQTRLQPPTSTLVVHYFDHGDDKKTVITTSENNSNLDEGVSAFTLPRWSERISLVTK